VQVRQLSRTPGRPPEYLVVHHQRATDADIDPEQEEVAEVLGCAGATLGVA